MKRYGICVFLCVLAMAGSSFGQGLSIKSAEFSVSYGHTSFQDKPFTIGVPQSAIPIKGDMQLGSGNMWEARINFYNSKHFGSEFLYGYQYSGVNFSRSTVTAGKFSVPLQVHSLMLNILYYPFGEAGSSWRPFINLGGGAVIYRPSTGGQAAAKDPLQGNFDTFFETSRGSGTLGIGVKHPITKSIGFRADVGEVLTKVPTFGLPESSALTNATVLPVGGVVASTRASAGVIFYLGK
jgi:hypothetical protein